MKLHTDITSIRTIERPILTIGTFDGVHLGHKVIIDRLNALALEVKGQSVLLTFHPHPRSVVREAGTIELLSTMEERLALLERAGLDHVIVHPFTREFSRISALEYVRDLLVNTIGVHTTVVGYDHHFGRNREGDISLLHELAEVYQFNVVEIDAQMIADVKVSSTKVRQALRSGEVKKVSKYLGYEYAVTGTVVKGDGRGRSIGFPTANVISDDPEKLIPGQGVYAVMVQAQSETYKGMLNIGTRPTFKEDEDALMTMEVNILGFDADLYGQQLTLSFIERIRSEEKFNSPHELRAQLEKDKVRTELILGSL